MKTVNARMKTILSVIVVVLVVGFWIPLFNEWEPFHKLHTYIPLVLLTLYTLIFSKDKKRSILITFAMAFGLVADFYIIILQSDLMRAMCFFMGAQVFYAILTFTFAKSKTEKIIQLCVRLTVTLIGILATYIVLNENVQALYVVSVAYYINMILNMIISYCHFKSNAFCKLVAIGLTLFALCDMAVGFEFLISIFSLGPGNIIYELKNTFNFSILFYIPSQTVLCLATKTE